MKKKGSILTAVILLVFAVFLGKGHIAIAAQTPQIPLAGSAIPQWIDQLPFLHTIDGTSGAEIVLEMKEFRSNVLSTGALVGYTGTTVWGYVESGQTIIPSYIGPVIVAKRNTATQIKFVNNLGTVASSNLTFWKYSTDQTLHWADPLNLEQNTYMKEMHTQPLGFYEYGTGGSWNYGQSKEYNSEIYDKS